MLRQVKCWSAQILDYFDLSLPLRLYHIVGVYLSDTLFFPTLSFTLAVFGWAERRLEADGAGRKIGGWYGETWSIKDDKIMNTVCKGCMLTAVSTEKWEPWSANKCSNKYVLVEKNGRRNSIFKIYKSYIFITMCQLTGSSYVQPKSNGPNLLEVYSHRQCAPESDAELKLLTIYTRHNLVAEFSQTSWIQLHRCFIS